MVLTEKSSTSGAACRGSEELRISSLDQTRPEEPNSRKSSASKAETRERSLRKTGSMSRCSSLSNSSSRLASESVFGSLESTSVCWLKQPANSQLPVKGLSTPTISCLGAGVVTVEKSPFHSCDRAAKVQTRKRTALHTLPLFPFAIN